MAYTDKQIERAKNILIESITNGVSLSRAIVIYEDIPSRPTVYTWLDCKHDNYDESFFNNYVRACEARADRIFEEIMTIADKQGKDIIKVDGKEITNHNVINRSRLMVDARKWILSKMNPKKYGEASLLKIANADDSEFKINAIFPNDGLYVPTDESLRKDKSTKKDD